jgi:hypothetical protein
MHPGLITLRQNNQAEALRVRLQLAGSMLTDDEAAAVASDLSQSPSGLIFEGITGGGTEDFRPGLLLRSLFPELSPTEVLALAVAVCVQFKVDGGDLDAEKLQKGYKQYFGSTIPDELMKRAPAGQASDQADAGFVASLTPTLLAAARVAAPIVEYAAPAIGAYFGGPAGGFVGYTLGKGFARAYGPAQQAPQLPQGAMR